MRQDRLETLVRPFRDPTALQLNGLRMVRSIYGDLGAASLLLL